MVSKFVRLENLSVTVERVDSLPWLARNRVSSNMHKIVLKYQYNEIIIIQSF